MLTKTKLKNWKSSSSAESTCFVLVIEKLGYFLTFSWDLLCFRLDGMCLGLIAIFQNNRPFGLENTPITFCELGCEQ